MMILMSWTHFWIKISYIVAIPSQVNGPLLKFMVFDEQQDLH